MSLTAGIPGDMAPRELDMQDDGRASLAIAAGLVAALVSGAIWAGLVLVTKLEIGYVALAIGLIVGAAMAKTTTQRSSGLALIAAVLAIVGLAAGKALTFRGLPRAMVDEFVENEEMMNGMMAWQMYADRELAPATLTAIDQTRASGDTVSNALWDDMTTQAAARVATMTEDEKRELAYLSTAAVTTQMSIVQGIMMTLSPFDLLWLFLAVGAAYRLMAPPKEATAT